MTSAELIQLGEQIAYRYRCRIKDAPARGTSPPLRRRQAPVKRLADNGRDRCTTLPREGVNPLVALIVDKNLQPVRQYAHTLACAYAGTGVSCACGNSDLAAPPARRVFASRPRSVMKRHVSCSSNWHAAPIRSAVRIWSISGSQTGSQPPQTPGGGKRRLAAFALLNAASSLVPGPGLRPRSVSAQGPRPAWPSRRC